MFLLPLERRLESSALCICGFGLSHLLVLWGWVVTQVASKMSQSSLVPASLHLGLWEQMSYQIKVPAHYDTLTACWSTETPLIHDTAHPNSAVPSGDGCILPRGMGSEGKRAPVHLQPQYFRPPG